MIDEEGAVLHDHAGTGPPGGRRGGELVGQHAKILAVGAKHLVGQRNVHRRRDEAAKRRRGGGHGRDRLVAVSSLLRAGPHGSVSGRYLSAINGIGMARGLVFCFVPPACCFHQAFFVCERLF